MTSWRNDPDLAGKLLPQHPDDLQVLVHDGEPRRTQRNPEACWVKITGTAGTLRSPVTTGGGPPGPPTPDRVRWLERTIYTGQLLNQPHQLASVAQGATVRFVHAPGIPHPLLVTQAYEAERGRWAVTPCDRCGADQMLDPPSVMARTRFPDAPPGAEPVAFTAFCPCGGTMMLAQAPSNGASIAPPPQRSAFGPSGPSAGSFAPPASAPVQPASGDNGNRILLFSALGCLGLVSMCCLSSVGGFFFSRSSHASAASAHAESFLAAAQRHDWNGALSAAEYGGGDGLYSADQMGRCLTATPLYDMTAYTCSGGDSEWPMEDRAAAICTITTPRGPTEITITVNAPDHAPYLGYVWFSPDAPLAPTWRSGECARWSGREYYREPPPGRIRPL